VHWLEISAQAGLAAGPAARTALQRWQAAGWTVDMQTVAGPAFWQTTEIEEAPALIEATVSTLSAAAQAIAATGAANPTLGAEAA
jgi:hypothetical protein